ncbi:hypothetical protein FTX61_07825 [Nitriliruptoraceae bacterium ZYF776]|nr:hypothetical protein [Profundirhabdus halotolerans]
MTGAVRVSGDGAGRPPAVPRRAARARSVPAGAHEPSGHPARPAPRAATRGGRLRPGRCRHGASAAAAEPDPVTDGHRDLLAHDRRHADPVTTPGGGRRAVRSSRMVPDPRCGAVRRPLRRRDVPVSAP